VGAGRRKVGALGSHGSSNRSRLLLALLWVATGLFTMGLGYKRYHAALLGRIGIDFTTYLHAARQVADGHSPYVVRDFVYSPVIALALSPFAHADPAHVWKAWTILEVASLVVGIAAFVAAQAGRLTGWRLPVLFAFCAATILHFWPVTVGLFLGQADPFVFAALMVSLWAVRSDRPVLRGIFIGVAGALKTWPAVLIVSVFQRGSRAKVRTLIAFGATLVVVPVLALIVGGSSGLSAFVRSVFDSRLQPTLVNDSATGVPPMLFSHSGLARPVLVSPALLTLGTIVFVAWVAALLVTTLRTRGDAVLCSCNVAFCVILLLPVSHLSTPCTRSRSCGSGSHACCAVDRSTAGRSR
jgi:uncharacterized membrane protein